MTAGGGRDPLSRAEKKRPARGFKGDEGAQTSEHEPQRRQRGKDSPRLTEAPGRTGTIVSVNVSLKKGQAKTPVPEVEVIAGEGLGGDAHRGFAHRQVSLLMIESIEAQRERLGGAARIEIGPGAYAENLTTRGLDLLGVAVGDEFIIAPAGIRLRVTQIGKECHTRCAIFKLAGDCIMPALGIFCEVLAGGTVRTGDRIAKR